ncbi:MULTISPECIES: DUF2568 domain-containing protein [unclassified Streptomyces]|uniref:DUF2568 domain-containing protein n=1 Tax=unclassified Streptomyces TaxID=2593676 RepID=UPI003D7618FB
MKTANLGVLFLVELGALGAAAYWGATVAWPLAVAAPVVLAALWALFGSPRARYRTSGAGRAGFEVLWFGAGVAALVAAGAPGWALALALTCGASKALAVRWGQ